MKSTFTAKYLQHLNKKNGNKGFTLIELLVVIIIVGVLAAIALPSFLNQIGKARGSEAKSNLGTVNRSQQAYRLENNTMSSQLAYLDAKVTNKFYNYAVAAVDANNATASATNNQSDLKGYSSRVQQSGDTFLQIICESANTLTSGTALTAPTSVSACAGATDKVIQ